MHAYLVCFSSFALGLLSGAYGQGNDPLDQLLSDAVSVITDFRSRLSVQVTATRSSKTSSTTLSTSQSSSSTTDSSTSSASPSTTPSTSSPAISSAATSSTGSSSFTKTGPITPNAASASASATAAAAAAASDQGQSNKSQTIAIALGVVFGVLALIALASLIFCCMRRRRRRRASKSHRSVSPDSRSRFADHDRHHGHSFADEKASYETDGLHRNTDHPIPLSPHARSHGAPAAAGVGGAALGGLAAKHHYQKQNEGNASHLSNGDRHHGISRKPVGGTVGPGANGHTTGTLANGAAPTHHPRHSGLPPGLKPLSDNHGATTGPIANGVEAAPRSHHSDLPPGLKPLSGDHGTGGGSLSGPGSSNSNPPAYNGNSHGHSPHFTPDHTHRHSDGHSPYATGAAGLGVGALGGAAVARHHDGNHNHNRNSAPADSGRRSLDTNRHSQSRPSILSNSSGRRSLGSASPHAPTRGQRRARFSDDVTGEPVLGTGIPPHNSSDQHDHIDNHAQHPTHHTFNQAPVGMSSGGTGGGDPRTDHMPGGWHDSSDWDNHKHISENSGTENTSSSDSVPRGDLNHHQDYQARNRSLTDVSSSPSRPLSRPPADRGEREGSWYRGRNTGGGPCTPTPIDPARSGYDSRFYSHSNPSRGSVGQAL
jgi:hypothetical protein